MNSPLIPNNVDLRNFPYMPLDTVRLRDSDFAALTDAEAFRAGILLWCASWHQVPAGSLPDDDRVLANLAGYGRVVKEWQKVRAEALHGWILCSDGRYYHPVICEKAMESWQGKLKHNYMKMCDRMRKENKRLADIGQPILTIPSIEDWISENNPSEIDNQSEIFPAESDNDSVGKQNDSAGNPSDFSLKGEERERDNIKKKERGISDWKPDLEFLNTKLKMAGGQAITESELTQYYQAFSLNFDTAYLTDNQWHGKLLNWVQDKQQRAKTQQARTEKREANAQDLSYFGIPKSEVNAKALDHETEYDCAFRLNQEKNKPVEQPPEEPIRKARPGFTINEDLAFKHLVSLNPDLTKLDIHERAELEGKPIHDVMYAMKKELEAAV